MRGRLEAPRTTKEKTTFSIRCASLFPTPMRTMTHSYVNSARILSRSSPLTSVLQAHSLISTVLHINHDDIDLPIF